MVHNKGDYLNWESAHKLDLGKVDNSNGDKALQREDKKEKKVLFQEDFNKDNSQVANRESLELLNN